MRKEKEPRFIRSGAIFLHHIFYFSFLLSLGKTAIYPRDIEFIKKREFTSLFCVYNKINELPSRKYRCPVRCLKFLHLLQCNPSEFHVWV